MFWQDKWNVLSFSESQLTKTWRAGDIIKDIKHYENHCMLERFKTDKSDLKHKKDLIKDWFKQNCVKGARFGL